MRNELSVTPADISLVPPIGASVWERGVFDHLTQHIVQERGLLEEYVKAARETESKALAYLIDVLVEDERRHHHLFKQLAQSLKSAAELRPDSPDVPRMDFHKENRAEVLEVTERLLEREESDALELKHLRKELSDVKDTTLWGLLVELMERDTDKHIAILRFAHKHAKHPVS
jgi:rubrerythrin